jgi:hypothetical protein
MICDVTHSHYTTFPNRSSLDKECSQIENEIALEKSKAIGRLNELETSLKTKLHRLRDKNEVILTDDLVKIKDINSQMMSWWVQKYSIWILQC